MSYLINRNPPARLQCLHYLCKFINTKYKQGVKFKMKDIKYNPEIDNILNYCNLLESNKLLDIQYCPYKENPLNTSGCSLTNGVKDDSTKSKEISNTINALEALGFLNRNNGDIQITEQGSLFANTNFDSNEMLIILRKSVLGYGMFTGFLAQIKLLDIDNFKTNEIKLGYPNSNESIRYKGISVLISSGSEGDSNTRTKSCLLAWGVSCGFFIPEKLYDNSYTKDTQFQTITKDYVLRKKRNLMKYKVLYFPDDIFRGDYIVNKPLDYNNLTKNTGALRENNQEKIRELTLQIEPKIKNRRYAIVYALNYAFINKQVLNFQKLIDYIIDYPNLFVVNKSTFKDVMYSELNIAFMVGTPFKVMKNNNLKPLVGINMKVVNKGAPPKLLTVMRNFNL